MLATPADNPYQEPRSGRLTAWGNALLTGAASPDDAAAAVQGTDDAHRVTGLPGKAPDSLHGLTWALGRLRVMGAKGFRLALPVAGHPLGLTGPPAFNSLALGAGEAVLAVGVPYGLVPEVEVYGPAGDQGVRVLWQCLPVNDALPADVPSLDEAERELADGLRQATAVLARLDVAGAGPETLRALESFRRRGHREALAPGYPQRAVRVLESARQVSALLHIAAGGHGAAVSASEMAARRDALAPLERTARRAQVAAHNAAVDERRG
ncbi:hypothetical protein [Kitasatospora cineracea]|uniref:hypothetical protein n=1 Tax=Kitasatospora cineracea TaxID=88074 RepID=UPI0036747BF7